MENKWLSNKIYMGDGIYKYKCSHNECPNTRMMHRPTDPEYNSSIYSKYCNYHYNNL